MADESNKLRKFQEAVFAEIDLKTSQIKQEAEQYKAREIEKSKDKKLDESYQIIQKKSQEIKQRCIQDVAKYAFDAKRSVLMKRNEITQRVFDNVTVKLNEYIKSDAYKAFLLKKIKEFKDKEGLSGVEIQVSLDDMKYAEDIKKVYALPCVIKGNDDITLGGFIVCDMENAIYFDETLQQKLESQKSYFIENSKLELYRSELPLQ